MQVGIDFSMNSPAVCIWDQAKQELYFYFWPQRVREENFKWSGVWDKNIWDIEKEADCSVNKNKKKKRGPVLRICKETGAISIPSLDWLTPSSTKNSSNKSLAEQIKTKDIIRVHVQAVALVEYAKDTHPMERYNSIVNRVLKILDKHILNDVTIGIEGYALNMKDSNCMSQLCEIGGILRSEIYKRGWKYAEISPASIKKRFTGSGNALKGKMIEKFIELGIIPNFYTTMLFKSDKKNDDVHPVQDIVDAFAILHYITTFKNVSEDSTPVVNNKRPRDP